jgi:hypothetical protein
MPGRGRLTSLDHFGGYIRVLMGIGELWSLRVRVVMLEELEEEEARIDDSFVGCCWSGARN